MTIAATTLRTIRQDFEAQIRGITPNFPLRQAATWRPVDRVEDAYAGRGRPFFVQMVPSSGLNQLIYGVRAAECRVHCQYADLPPREIAEMADADGIQLWAALEARVNVLDGLIEVLHEGFVDESDPEDDMLLGFHRFEVAFMSNETV